MKLEFEKDEVKVTFTPEEGIKKKTYKVKVYAQNKTDGGGKKVVYTSKAFNLIKGENVYSIWIDYYLYNLSAKKIVKSGNSLPNIIDFSFKVLIGETESEIQNTITVHFVRYIPKLLNILGFKNGEKLQRIWFTKGNNTDKKIVDPEVDIVEWNWVTSESAQIKGEAKEFMIDTLIKFSAAFNNKVKRALKGEINRMIAAGLTSLPTVNYPKRTFGVTDASIITHNGEKAPKFEKYYFNSKPFSGFWDIGMHYIFDGFDDSIASLANFNYHMFATGELVYDKGNRFFNPSVKIKIKKLGVYIKDSWDFIDDDPSSSQNLGWWKINGKNSIEIENSVYLSKSDYFHVTNKSYQDYRNDHGVGYNYHLYSTIHYENINATIKL